MPPWAEAFLPEVPEDAALEYPCGLDGDDEASGLAGESEFGSGSGSGSGSGFVSGAGIPRDLSWRFDDAIPEDARAYILRYWDDVGPLLHQTMGPPSAAIVVTVRHNPYMTSGGTYDSWSNTLSVKRLPVGADDGAFNQVFTHETVHAFQDAALGYSHTSWAAEGVAVCASAMVGEMIRPGRAFADWWNLAYLAANYDSLSQMGGHALSGVQYFPNAPSFFDCYTASGGFWFILTASQSEAAAGDFGSYDFLSRFSARLYETGRAYRQADVLLTIAETAVLPVDGLAASEWTAAQPITNVRGDAGVLLWAGISSGPFGIGSPSFANSSPIRIGVFWRSYPGGSSTPIFDVPVSIRARDTAGREVWNTTVTIERNPFGFPVRAVTLPDSIRLRPGAYSVEIESSVEGVGKGRTTLAIQVVPMDPWQLGRSHDSAWGMGAVFFDNATGRTLEPSFGSDGESLGDWSGSYLVRPWQTVKTPASVQFEIKTSGGTLRTSRTAPLPYRRVFAIGLHP
ncbi:MAG: hypothetical protein HYY18_17460 [Planctomycetes bacterium]|nr:hypothetical protein [Planctomycetota bacterium]